MKKNKILAGLSALVMGATMMAGTAMSASAYCIHDAFGCVGDGGFYAYYDSDGDGTQEWAPAPHGMYDGNITGVIANDNGTYTLTLDEATYTITYTVNGVEHSYQVQGTIDSISTTEGGSNLISNGQVTLAPDTTYYVYVVAHNGVWYQLQFRIGSCTCSNCNC